MSFLVSVITVAIQRICEWVRAITCGIAACAKDANGMLSKRADGHELLCILITCAKDANGMLGIVSTGEKSK